MTPRRLVAGDDYPRTYREFVEMFPNAAVTGPITEADVTHDYKWDQHKM
jgi:hypothetical protein